MQLQDRVTILEKVTKPSRRQLRWTPASRRFSRAYHSECEAFAAVVRFVGPLTWRWSLRRDGRVVAKGEAKTVGVAKTAVANFLRQQP